MYDAIIVGARCAGASTAMLLARKGHRVLLVERAKFPSDIPHGHFIHRGGPARFARWGLLDRILQAARLGPPPEDMKVLFAALRDRGDDARQFFLARQGLIPPETFFNPANMQRIMATARR